MIVKLKTNLVILCDDITEKNEDIVSDSTSGEVTLEVTLHDFNDDFEIKLTPLSVSVKGELKVWTHGNPEEVVHQVAVNIQKKPEDLKKWKVRIDVGNGGIFTGGSFALQEIDLDNQVITLCRR
jgi:hypothetical protein